MCAGDEGEQPVLPLISGNVTAQDRVGKSPLALDPVYEIM